MFSFSEFFLLYFFVYQIFLSIKFFTPFPWLNLSFLSCLILENLDGFKPATGSPTTTLLRLHPSYRLQFHKYSCKNPILRLMRSHTRLDLSQFPWRDGRYVLDLRTYSPWLGDPRLLAIPPSRCRVTDNDLDWDTFCKIRSYLHISFPLCQRLCSTCVAQFIWAMQTRRHPYLSRFLYFFTVIFYDNSFLPDTFF